MSHFWATREYRVIAEADVKPYMKRDLHIHLEHTESTLIVFSEKHAE